MAGSGTAPICANPRCYQAKQEAVWKKIKANAEDNGKRWMDVDRTCELFLTHGDYALRDDRGLVDLSGKPGYEEVGHYGEVEQSWEELLKGTEAAARAITARHPKTGRIHQLLEREDAIRLAIEADPAVECLFDKRPGKKKEPVVKLTKTVPAQKEEAAVLEITEEEEVQEQEQEPATRPVVVDGAKEQRQKHEALWDRLRARVGRGMAHRERCDVVRVLAQALTVGGVLTEGSKREFGADLLESAEDVVKLLTAEIGGDDGWEKWLLLLGMMLASRRDGGGSDTARLLERQAPMAEALGLSTSVMEEQTEVLLSCEGCGRSGFTERGMKAHRCRGAEPAEEPAEPETPKRGLPAPLPDDVKVRARELYDLGLGKERIAKELGLSPNTVGAWQKREWPKRQR